MTRGLARRRAPTPNTMVALARCCIPCKAVRWKVSFHERHATIFLWIVSFMNWLNLYFLPSRRPTIVTSDGAVSTQSVGALDLAH